MWGAVTALGVVAGYLAVLLADARHFYTDDTEAQYAPMWVLLGTELREGRFPALVPWEWMAGNYSLEEAALLNPPQLLVYLIAPSVDDLAVYATVVKLVFSMIAGLGVYRICLAYGAKPAFGAVAGVAFPLSGWFLFFDQASWFTSQTGTTWLLHAWASAVLYARGKSGPIPVFVFLWLTLTIQYVFPGVEAALMILAVVAGEVIHQKGWAGPLRLALVARNGTGIDSIAGLRGKRVATAFASTAHYSLLAALDRNGLRATDVQLVDLQPQASLAAWERGDVDAVYTWLPTLDQLRATGKTLITSRELATAGKPTLDLGVVSKRFAQDHPEVVDTWRRIQARALDIIHNTPDAAAKAVAAEIGITPDVAAQQLKQGVFLTKTQLTSSDWLGSEGSVGNIAANLRSAAEFLAAQQQIDAAPPAQTFQDAIYVKGLPGVLDQ
ncbi:taurine ABC transporter substrate-binding protein [Nocardia crassostreae]|uniref:taurine ABC transporter substrate-binding protein n=1 Tax=Nocardia crassostreae TaxID=53428 RepID=UPI000B1C680D|nr:ABC transporter substrate-binding protein [Nocardia crassostreae]